MFTKKENKEEKQLDLHHLKTKLSYEIKYLREYFSFTHDLTAQKDKQLSDAIYKDAQNDPENEALLQRIYDEEKNALLSYYHHSAIVLIYTVLESTLSELCDEVRNLTSAKFSHENISGGTTIGKLIDYLKLTSSLDYDLIDDPWARIGQFRHLRNSIVHQNSTVSGKKEKERITNNFNKIIISDLNNKFFMLDDTLVYEFLDKIESLFKKLFLHLESVIFVVEIPEFSAAHGDDLPF